MDVVCEKECLRHHLSGLLSPRESGRGGDLAEILIGSKQIRMGGRPTAENEAYLRRLLTSYQEVGEPLQAVSMWGALKCYGLGDNQPDMADALALRRLAIIEAAVKAVYPPGIQIHIFREDLTEFFLSSDCCLSIGRRSADYWDGLRRLIDAFNLPFLQIHAESTLLHKAGGDLSSFFRQIEGNAEALRAYWESCLEFGEEKALASDAWIHLANLGWRGSLPVEQRRYYLERAASEYPDADMAKLQISVCRYLGNALARKQFGILRFRGKGRRGPLDPLKIAFNPHPPGTPLEMYRGRLQYKLRDDKNSNKTLAPWSAFSLYDGGECRAIGVREWRAAAMRSVTVKIVGNGVSAPISILERL